MSYSITAIIMNPTKHIDTLTTCWVERHGRLHQANKASGPLFVSAPDIDQVRSLLAEEFRSPTAEAGEPVLFITRQLNQGGAQ